MSATIFELRDTARAQDLRNRVIAPEASTWPRSPACSRCGNLLTIVDRGSYCWQCYIERKSPGQGAS